MAEKCRDLHRPVGDTLLLGVLPPRKMVSAKVRDAVVETSKGSLLKQTFKGCWDVDYVTKVMMLLGVLTLPTLSTIPRIARPMT